MWHFFDPLIAFDPSDIELHCTSICKAVILKQALTVIGVAFLRAG